MNASSKQEHEEGPVTTETVKKTISLPKATFDRGMAHAALARRNFSNFIATLIEKDGEELKTEGSK